MSETVLEFRNVSWTYEDAEEKAVKDISFAVKKGEFVGIIGVNDAGKSTVCRIANGLIPNSIIGKMEGTVEIKGEDIKGKPTASLAQSIGSVFADPEAQMSQITVFHELAFGPANLTLPKEEVIARVEKVIGLMELERFRNRSPFSLSGGEQQRVAIASVLTMNPEILVLDEPTSNLDPVSTENIFEVVSTLNKENNMTVIMVEHEIELMAKYADRIIVIDKGEIVMDGTVGVVFSRKDVFDRIGIHIPSVKLVDDEIREQGHWEGLPKALTLETFTENMKKGL